MATGTPIDTSTSSLYSVDSLAVQLNSVVQGESTGSSEDPADTLLNIVREALRHIWGVEDWLWMRRTGTLSISADDTSEDLPANFRKMDTPWMQDNDEASGWLHFTNHLRELTGVRTLYKTGHTGRPEVACIAQDVSDPNVMAWTVQLAPASNADYVYDYVFLPLCPIELANTHADYRADDDVITMPSAFHQLWHDQALYRAKVQFRFKPEVWTPDRAEYRRVLEAVIKEQNETLTSAQLRMRDGYGDMQSIGGVGWLATEAETAYGQ